MTPEIDAAIYEAAQRQEAWVTAQIREHAPALADVPEKTARFLSNVQRMLVASTPREAAQYAADVAEEAGPLAALQFEWKRLQVYYLARAPMELRITVPK